MSTESVLTRRALNRATLQRQHLLQRSALSPMGMVEHLVGMQAQEPNPPYFGLWSRLQSFKREDLSLLLEQRLAVRCTLQRGTLHLVSAADLFALRPLMQQTLARLLTANHGKKLGGAGPVAVARMGRALLCAESLDSTQLGKRLALQWPDAEPASLAVAVRCLEPLIQVPPAGTWDNHKNAQLVPADIWLNQALPNKPSLGGMLLRYLAAFGPASAQDAGVWSGLALSGPDGITAALEQMAPQLRRYRDEHGRLLYDLQEADLPSADTPAPARLVAGYDNLMLSHADRRRIFDEQHRPHIFTSNGQIRATVLLDGFAQGIWKMEHKHQRATVVIEPFRALNAGERQQIEHEAALALDFAAPGGVGHGIRFDKPSA